MREILFRGKRLDNGEWVEGGDLVQLQNSTFIHTWVKCCREAFLVDPSTAGQFTGLYDKNGKRIFEGDVVNYRLRVPTIFGIFQDETIRDVVEWNNIICGFYPLCGIRVDLCCEVIGNIHDNPELLKEYNND